MTKGKEFISQLKMYSDYMKWDDNLNRYETWEEACDKILNTHVVKYGEKIKPYVDEIKQSLYNKEFLASQRNLQFRGESIFKHNSKIYNCCTVYAYSPDVFNKGFYVLLSGAGLGVSLKRKYVSQLPKIHKRGKDVKLFIVEDSIEGWSEAVKALISSYCQHESLYSEYFGYRINFDYTEIRPKGAYISGGFKAPGHEGLKSSIDKIESLLNNRLNGDNEINFKSIIVYDILMHISDAVLSGGVRRSAMNVIIDEDDTDMIYAKTGNWRETEPQRARSNNSVGLLKGQFSKEKLDEYIALNSGDNDLGFVFMNHEDEIFNPCFTINQRILTDNGWKSFDELLIMQEKGEDINILQDNRVEGVLEDGKEEWIFDYNKSGVTTNKVTKISKTGENKPIFKLETVCGREVEATEDHHFATKRGMIMLKDLTINDEILIQVNDLFESNKDSYDYKIGFLYGLYYGDGTNEDNSTLLDIWIKKGYNDDILNKIQNDVKYVIDYKRPRNIIGNTHTTPTFKISKKTDKYTKYRLTSKLLTDIFKFEGFNKKGDLNELQSKNKNFKSGFLSGFIYTDGMIDYSNSSKSISIRISQSNKKALQNTQLVLQELGVFSKVYLANKSREVKFHETQKSYITKDSYRLVIPGQKNTKNSLKFIELFDYKNDRFNMVTENNNTTKVVSLYGKVKKIEYLRNDDVYCLEENNNRTLIVEGLTARRCFEIGFNFYDKIKNKNESTYQFCNLCEINASASVDYKGNFSENKFYDLCRKASIIGTLQAGYTDFPYLGKQTEDIVSGEALIGVSITGWMSRPELFNEEILKKGANIVKNTNREVADLIGINYAARTTTVKPSGNASVLLKTSSGIHPEHSKRYFRIMQLNKDSETAKWLEANAPSIIEDSKWSSSKTDYVVYSPCENHEKVIVKNEMHGIKHLDLIKLVQNSWVSEGKEEAYCYNPLTTHNVSNTVIIDDINEISNYIYDNQKYFAAVSFLSSYGDKDYVQAPFTSVLNTEELVQMYGDGAMFMAGLIVDGLHYFDDDLWAAVSYVMDDKKKLAGDRDQSLLRKDWIRRVKKFAKNYFRGDLQKTMYCMKDVHLWHKWNVVNREFKLVNFSEILTKPKFEDISKYGAISCNGGACEIV